MEALVSIIILNWNGLNDTVECLKSLSQINYKNYEIILVDNNSEGNDVLVFKNEYKSYYTHLILNSENIGFAGGNNIGIKYALRNKPDFILLLNNDTVVEPNFLTNLISKSDCDENIGIITPMICYYSEKSKVWHADGEISKVRASGFANGMGRDKEKYQYEKLCSFASGCSMLINSNVFETVGFLDENYFLYLEDTDFCNRVVIGGYKILYTGSSIVYHKINGASLNNNLLPLHYVTRNRFYFASKMKSKIKVFSFTYLVIVVVAKIFIFYLTGRSDKSRVLVRSMKAYFNKNLGRAENIL